MEPAGSTCYDWSVGQILIYPAYNQARLRNPPLTSHLVGTPRGFKCIGVDYLSLDFEANELDLARTYNIVRMRLAELPAGSSQERVLNILKRRYYLERLGWKHELKMDDDQTEKYIMLSRITSGNSLCGMLYTRNPESDMRLDIPSFYTRRMSTAMNASIKYKARGCLKYPKLDLGPKWWSLMVDSRLLPVQMATELKTQLRNMIIKPAVCKQMESDPKELKISLVPPIKIFSNSYNFDTGIDADSPSNVLYDYSIFETYQGHLMNTQNASVSFNWSVEQRIIPDGITSMADSPLAVFEDTFLRIDTG